jgi:hypothetical protein
MHLTLHAPRAVQRRRPPRADNAAQRDERGKGVLLPLDLAEGRA